MANCELLAGCIFFNDKMEGKPATAALMKANYCQGDSSKCARFMVFREKGRPAVPADLFPHEQDRARKILAGG